MISHSYMKNMASVRFKILTMGQTAPLTTTTLCSWVLTDLK